MNIETTSFSSDDKTFLIFKEVSKELHLSTREISKITGKLLRVISRSLDKNEFIYWLENLPELFKLLLVKEWRNQESPTTLDHLDILVDSVYQDDQESTERVFYSEIHALESILVLLRKMEQILGIFSFPGFRFSFVREVKQVA